MVVTKADVYEKVIFAERPACPHCGERMRISECDQGGLSCGSGWGTPYLFICMNSECPPFVQGWENMHKNFGRRFSYRCICFPDSRKTELMMVTAVADGQSDVIKEEIIKEDQARGTAEDPAVQALVRGFEVRDIQMLLSSLLDPKAHYKVRQKAAELVGELGLEQALEPLRHHRFKDQRVAASAHDAIKRIHQVAGTRECPYCAEVIDAGAAVCSECGSDLSKLADR